MMIESGGDGRPHPEQSLSERICKLQDSLNAKLYVAICRLESLRGTTKIASKKGGGALGEGVDADDILLG